MSDEDYLILWRKYLLKGVEEFDRKELIALFVYLRDELYENDDAGVMEDKILTTAFRKVSKALGFQSEIIRPTSGEGLGTP